MANLKTKNAPPEFEQDWHTDPDKPTLARINKIIGLTEMRQSEKLLHVDNTKTVEPVEMSKVFGYDNKTKQWTHLGYRCWECGKVLREGRITEKHTLIWNHTIKIHKSEEDEILSKVKGYKHAYKKD